MNIDLSYNHHGRARGGGGETQLERNQNSYDERFHLNQYYTAVEDEQTTMDEYTSLLHSYNNFIVNGNAMFSRMEQTLRENVTRCIVRQHFYYNQYHLHHSRGITAGPTVSSSPQMTPVPVPAPAPASPITDIFPRLLSRYLNTEISREARQPNNNNIFSMLYTVPAGVRTTTNVSSVDTSSAPTNEQIRRATHDTVFGNIITPVNATCPISRDEFTDESEITMIRGCNHIFNRECLREWFARHSSCPLCRSDIRDYLPSSNQSTITTTSAGTGGASHRFPANLSIDHIDENNFTFSYDIPMNYNDSQLYNDIVNTVNHINRNSNFDAHEDDDDVMNVD